jgi:chromosome segregation ATPase
MPTVTDTDLKEIKDLITTQAGQLTKINETLTEIKINQAQIKGEINILEERLSGQIMTLDEKVSGTNKRLDIIESRVNGLTGWLIGILFAFVGGFLGILGKIAFFPNP